jgi:NADPH-dependent curcumin reductase CurA
MTESTESTQSTEHQRIVLASRPKGAPTAEHFRLERGPIPAAGPGQMLLRTLYLSLDPYMRGRMSDAPSYAAPVAVGAVMVGGTVSVVQTSNVAGFAPGDRVVAYTGWQTHALSDGKGVQKLDPKMPHLSLALGVLGMPGFTAYMGLTDIGAPREGETVVVGAATGAVGAVVGQVARLLGCRAVGIAGGADKCKYATETLRFDACVDHKSPALGEALAAACPKGIDVYFENVGGAVFDAVLPLLNAKARIPLCGLIASYNATSLPAGPDRTALVMGTILRKRIRVQGFIISEDYGRRVGEFLAKMGPWVAEGKIVFREDVVDGLSNAPQAFMGMLEGKNFGKVVVKVADA